MSQDDSRGFFRGAEFSRLLILAGLLLVGWPAVYYFGFAGVKPQPPRNDAIAKLPPLPQPDADPVLTQVRDVSPRAEADTPAKAYLLEKVRSHGKTLSQISRREVLPVDLLRNPARYRGLPLHLEGYAKQVYAVDDIPIELSPSGRLYEVWMTTLDHDQRIYPVCLVLENVPASLAGGRDLAERIAFDGYFYRTIAYRAGDANRFAPLLIGRLVHYPELSQPVDTRRNWFWTLLPVGLLAVYLFLRFFFSLRRIRRNIPATRSRLERTDEIAPESLEAWLETPETDHDDPSA